VGEGWGGGSSSLERRTLQPSWVWQNVLASPAPDPLRGLASFGAVILGFVWRFIELANGFVPCRTRNAGFVWRFTQLANGFVRRGRNWLRSARGPLASFGALPSLATASFGALGFVRRPASCSGHHVRRAWLRSAPGLLLRPAPRTLAQFGVIRIVKEPRGGEVPPSSSPHHKGPSRNSRDGLPDSRAHPPSWNWNRVID
jgi:hypothetical protein